MYVVNKQFELLEFVFDSVYVDLQYDVAGDGYGVVVVSAGHVGGTRGSGIMSV